MLSGYELARKIVDLMLEKKAMDVKIIDLKGQNTSFDFFVLATGTVDQHIRTISEYVRRELSQEGVKPVTLEGTSNLTWVLQDYSDVIVHIFNTETRAHYRLETLFDDCEIEEYTEESLVVEQEDSED
ncbi:MAG: ribosome silencing factor [Candidatus Delongbacteria bacterium]|nr:ribosome silencing factor [Candidatus Delongbacteria bacterium]MBN2836463.1 ribosome silencing factor [Candidatus Delongbacteria bacterium]